MEYQFDPAYWRAKADEARLIGANLRDPDARRTMLQIAVMYSGMALRAQQRMGERVTSAVIPSAASAAFAQGGSV